MTNHAVRPRIGTGAPVWSTRYRPLLDGRTGNAGIDVTPAAPTSVGSLSGDAHAAVATASARTASWVARHHMVGRRLLVLVMDMLPRHWCVRALELGPSQEASTPR